MSCIKKLTWRKTLMHCGVRDFLRKDEEKKFGIFY